MRTNRIFVAMCIFLAVYVLLGGKIAYYQLWCGSELTQEAAAMRNKQIQLKEYSRGEILDRNLVSLTSTNSSNGLYCLIDNHYSESPEESISELTDALARVFAEKDINTSQWAAELMCAYQMGKPYIRIAADLTDEEILRIESLQAPGLVVAPVIKRYGSDGFCAHLLGYVSKSEIAQGQAGIEREYDEILREGNAGQELVTVFDARGMAISGLMFKVKEDPKQKSNMVVLTIDKRVQEIVEKVMNEQVETGAVVVMDTKSREILAMASRPTFNPYQVENFLADKNRALSNRALNRYYPGSLFKIVVAAAALEENLVSPSDHFFCNGQYIFNEDLAISCWNKEGHNEHIIIFDCESQYILGKPSKLLPKCFEIALLKNATFSFWPGTGSQGPSQKLHFKLPSVVKVNQLFRNLLVGVFSL
jgi:penicillin-binding protein 2